MMKFFKHPLITELALPILAAALIGFGSWCWLSQNALACQSTKIDNLEKTVQSCYESNKGFIKGVDSASKDRDIAVIKNIDNLNMDIREIREDVKQLLKLTLEKSTQKTNK